MWTFVAVQSIIPALALAVRWSTPEACFVRFGWQMFSCALG